MSDVTIWEIWYDILFRPLSAMRCARDSKSIGRSVITFAAGALFPFWAVLFALGGSQGVSVSILIGLHIAVSLFVWFFSAATLHLVAELAGGQGTAVGLFCAFGYTYLPRLFLIPAAMVAILLPVSLKPLMLSLCIALITLWTLALDVQALRGCYGFAAAKAALVLAVPALAAAGAVLLLVFLSGSALISALGG